MTSPTPRRGRVSRRTTVILIIAAVLVVALGALVLYGPAFYRDVIVGEAPEAPTVGASGTGGPTASATPAADPLTDLDGSWSASDGSFAGYRVNEVLNGTDVTVVGRTDQVTAEVTVDGLAVTAGTITVDVGSISTPEAARDAYFRDSALHVSDFPTATFELTQPVEAAEAPAAGGTTTAEATGELTLHGVTQQVTAELQVGFDGRTAEVAGSIPITFADYDVQAPSLGFVRVEPEGSVEFHLVLDKAE